uniref:Uncharacterized protein n=1 Tax=viral metagenome TaxID=1070528 RepID=A0A6M3J3N8_9ZZZZ
MDDGTLLVIAGMAMLGFFGFLVFMNQRNSTAIPSSDYLSLEKDASGNIIKINGYPIGAEVILDASRRRN